MTQVCTSRMKQEITTFFEGLEKWREELLLLREIVLQSELEETIKWKTPCYTDNDKNIVILQNFKNFFALGFFKGSLHSDPQSKLISPGKNTQSGKYLKFENREELVENKELILSYIKEAIEIERAGKKISYTTAKELKIPEELANMFTADPLFESAFNTLTPGRQKGYILHFSQAKQSTTRSNRINQYKERIMNGKGLHDCVCGLSKRMPNCDGSHKQLDHLVR